jgi:PKD repeat protein
VKIKVLIIAMCVIAAVSMFSGCVQETTNEKPEASFTYDPMENIYPETELTFTDASTDADGTVAAWVWDFGDDANSTDQNPTHSYAAIGTYTVSLTVTDDSEEASDPYTMDITVTNVPPTADFTYDPMVNITNTTVVTFTDASTIGDVNISAWSWDFDADGVEDANESTTTYTFATDGDHEVTLTVTDLNEMTATVTKTITVETPEE